MYGLTLYDDRFGGVPGELPIGQSNNAKKPIVVNQHQIQGAGEWDRRRSWESSLKFSVWARSLTCSSYTEVHSGLSLSESYRFPRVRRGPYDVVPR